MSLLLNSFRQSFMQMSTPGKLVLLLFLILVFALIGSFVSVFLAMPLYHYNLSDITRIIENPDAGNINILKFFQILQSITLFIVPALLAGFLFSEKTFEYLKLSRKASWITLFMVIMSVAAAIPLLNLVTDINSRLDLPYWLGGIEQKMIAMEENADKLTDLFLVSNSTGVLLVNILMIAILPAVGEELLFRGVLQRLMTEWTRNAHFGILISAFIFSFIHFQFFGFIPRLLLGLYFGYLFFWSGSIWVPITGHLINNGLAVVYYHFASKPAGDTALDTLGTGGSSNYLVYLSVFTTSIIIAMIYISEKKRRESIQ